jgi:hypothetical protein
MSVMSSGVLSVTLRHVKCLFAPRTAGDQTVQGILFVPRDNLERAEDAYCINVSSEESCVFGRYSALHKDWCMSVCVCVCVSARVCACA